MRNAIRCTFCGAVIESKHRHDYQLHTCQKMQEDWERREGLDRAIIAVDGGKDYKRRVFSHPSYFEEVE